MHCLMQLPVLIVPAPFAKILIILQTLLYPFVRSLSMQKWACTGFSWKESALFLNRAFFFYKLTSFTLQQFYDVPKFLLTLFFLQSIVTSFVKWRYIYLLIRCVQLSTNLPCLKNFPCPVIPTTRLLSNCCFRARRPSSLSKEKSSSSCSHLTGIARIFRTSFSR